MVQLETADSIDAAAAEWVAREDRAPLTPAQEEALAAWLEGDPRRAGALLRARAVALRSQSAAALGRQYDPVAFGGAPAPPSRRQMLSWGASASLALAAVVAGVGVAAPQAYATGRGEVRLVPLADGSTVMLNTETRVRVRYDGQARRLRLEAGEAYFTVLDDHRPLVVEVGERRIVASSGAFRVRKLKDGPLDVLVHQGQVEVRADDAAVALAANTELVLAKAQGLGAPHAVSVGVVTRELAWRDGKIAFEGETLAQAASAFARYSDTRIVVDDPVLAAEPVVGLYSANDPAGFARAVAEAFGAQALSRGRTVILRRTPGPIKVS